MSAFVAISKEDAKAAGLRRYFTGVPCIHGHVCQRYVSGGQCFDCHAIARAIDYKRRKDSGQVAEYHRGHRAKNKDKYRQAHKKWRETHQDFVKARLAKWERENKAWRKQWRTGRRDKDRIKDKRFYSKNKLWFRAKVAFQKAQKKRATPAWVDRKALRRIYLECPKGWQVDHIVPINSKVVCGLHVPWNLQFLTAEDNLKKGNKLVA